MKIKVLLFLTLIIVSSILVACGGANVGDGSSPTRVTKSTAPQLLEPDDHAGGYGWENDKCFLCHPVVQLQDIHSFSEPLGDSFAKVGDDDIGACLYCHGSNGLSGITADTYQCVTCHQNSSIVSKAGMFSGHNMHDLDHDGQISNSDCVICHSFSDMNGVMDLSIDLTAGGTAYNDTNDFCLACHDGNGAFGVTPPALSVETEVNNIYATYMGVGDTAAAQKLTADIHGIKDGNGQSFADFRGLYAANTTVSCLSCHQVHSSDNEYLITESGESADLADEAALNAHVSVIDSDFSELCALCHATAGGGDTANGLTEVVHTSTYSSNCISCHYHGAGYGASTADLF
ncbi:MAG: hypothetical protein AB7E76_07100 [Deferribacterales bacterium]